MSPKPDKVVAFCGTRGLPASYGGFETVVDELSRRFVDAGYACDVLCRYYADDNKPASSYQGRRLVYVRGSRRRALDTFVSSARTGLYLLRHRERYSHAYWFNNANLPGILLTALARIPVTVNTDGLEWRRAKWRWPFKAYYYFSSMCVSLVCRSLVSDSRAIQKYYRRRFRRRTTFVPYGAPVPTDVSSHRQVAILESLGLKAGSYFLQITRVEPDNLPLEVAEGFVASGLAEAGMRMVLVGYKEATAYARRLMAHNGRSGVQVHEATYDQETLYALRQNCFCYVHGNSVGGTNPALVEAMACCPRVLALDCEFSREVLGKTGQYFDRQDIGAAMRNTVPTAPSEDMRDRVHRLYQWDAVAESYMRLGQNQEAVYDPQPVALECARRIAESTVRQVVTQEVR